MSAKPFGTGRCLCGAITFTVAAVPVTMGQCHCKDCQRATGTGHISNARFRCEDVSVSGDFFLEPDDALEVISAALD